MVLNAGGMVMPLHALTFDRGELRGALISQKIAKSRKPTEKVLRNSNLQFNKSNSQKGLFLTYHHLLNQGTLAHHVHAAYASQVSTPVELSCQKCFGVS